MLDPTFIRDHVDEVRAGLKNRGLDTDKALEDIATLESRRRRLSIVCAQANGMGRPRLEVERSRHQAAFHSATRTL